MSIIYQLKANQKHGHLKFAYVDGHHHCDFAAHKHDFSELFLVVSGSGEHTVADHVYPLKKGDVFVIKGNIEHGFRKVDKLKIINLMFDADNPFFEIPSMRQLSGYQAMFKVEPIARQTTEYNAMLTLDNSQRPVIEGLMQKIRTEYESAEPGFEVMLTSLMQQLVTTLSRFYQQQKQDLPQTTLALSRALVFVEQNFMNAGLNSDAIADAAFVSKRQLERLFRQFLDVSPNQYLRDIQLGFACKLLEQKGDLSIQHIAEQCGFSDSNYFSKCFKQKYQRSPREHRKHILALTGGAADNG